MAALLFTVAAQAQDTAKIKAMAEDACGCTDKISAEMPRDSIIEHINSCITSEIMRDQMAKTIGQMKELTDAAVAAKKDTVIGGNKTYTIVVDEGFDEIQAYMRDNCEQVKYLMANNNKMHKNSMSKDKKALKFYKEGQEYSAREEYDMAIVSYNKAVKADSKFAFAWDNLGITYRQRGNYEEAIKCYKKSLEADPDGTMPLQNIPVAYMYLEKYQEAAKGYDILIKKYPEDPEGYFGASRAYYFLKDYEKGLDNLFKSYRIYNETKSPYKADAEKMMGAFYQDLKEQGKLDLFKEIAKKNNINFE